MMEAAVSSWATSWAGGNLAFDEGVTMSYPIIVPKDRGRRQTSPDCPSVKAPGRET